MSTPENQNQEDYGLSVEQAQEYIAAGEKIYRLMKNKDFQDIIMDGFIKQSALNKVSLLAVPAMRKERDNIILELEAISILDSYLRNIQKTAAQMKISLDEFHAEQLAEAEDEAKEV